MSSNSPQYHKIRRIQSHNQIINHKSEILITDTWDIIHTTETHFIAMKRRVLKANRFVYNNRMKFHHPSYVEV